MKNVNWCKNRLFFAKLFLFLLKTLFANFKLPVANVLILMKRMNELFETIFFISLLLA